MPEWTNLQRWNPFNSYKLLAHVHRWKHIGLFPNDIPPPILVTIDPTNACNLNCVWCNAAQVRKYRKTSLSRKTMLELADFSGRWENSEGFKVRGYCIAGGGEPLLNPHTGKLIERLIENNIEVGVVTNGILIDKFIEPLSKCTWVGVSIDAAYNETYQKLKRTRYSINTVFDNIKELIEYSKIHNTRLAAPHPSYGVSYKYLLYPDNMQEVRKATKIAKDIGCKNIHFRPASTTWDKLGEQEIVFSADHIGEFNNLIKEAQDLAEKNFGVYGVTHKFDSQFQRQHNFEKCWAVFMTAVFMPRSHSDVDKDAFIMGLCCDRRGDPKLELLKDCTDVKQIESVWSGEKHWNIHNSINPRIECPRCTFSTHCEIYEQVILNDSMTYKFI